MKEYWQDEFAVRFRRHADELKWLYYELYRCDAQAYDYFTDMLYRLWEERPEKLKMIDREREACPDWYKGHRLTGMLMYTDAFAGNLRGVLEKGREARCENKSRREDVLRGKADGTDPG